MAMAVGMLVLIVDVAVELTVVVVVTMVVVFAVPVAAIGTAMAMVVVAILPCSGRCCDRGYRYGRGGGCNCCHDPGHCLDFNCGHGRGCSHVHGQRMTTVVR